jgi:hypothetical protein
MTPNLISMIICKSTDSVLFVLHASYNEMHFVTLNVVAVLWIWRSRLLGGLCKGHHQVNVACNMGPISSHRHLRIVPFDHLLHRP